MGTKRSIGEMVGEMGWRSTVPVSSVVLACSDFHHGLFVCVPVVDLPDSFVPVGFASWPSQYNPCFCRVCCADVNIFWGRRV